LPSRRLVIAADAHRDAATLRVDAIAASGADATLALIRRGAGGLEISLRAQGAGPPCGLSASANDPDALARLLQELHPDAIEIDAGSAMPLAMSQALARAVAETSIPVYRLIAGRPLPTPPFAFAGHVAIDAMGRALLAPPGRQPPAIAPAPPPAGAAVGILLPADAPSAIALLLELAPVAEAANVRFVVIGGTSSERRLMGRGLFVTGPAGLDDYPFLVERHAIRRLVLPYRDACYFAVANARRAKHIPAAYFDWSGAAFREFGDDLSLSPDLSDAEAVGAVKTWLSAHEP
jgi:hypothetical protein